MNETTLHLTFYIELFYIKAKQNYNTFTVPFEKSKTVSFASSIMENIVAPPLWFRFPVKLFCCIAFGSALVVYLDISINL